MFTLTQPLPFPQQLTLSPPSLFPQSHPLPSRNQIILSPQFLSKATQLSTLKHQRLSLNSQHQTLTNSYLLLQRSNTRTTREISKQHQHIQYLIEVKKRKEEEMEEKRKVREDRQRDRREKGRKIEESKQGHRERLDNSMGEMMSNNKSDYQEWKRLETELNQQRRDNTRLDFDSKRTKSSNVNHSKYLGLRRMVDYKMKRNQQHIRQYNQRILKQEQKIEGLVQGIQIVQKDTEDIRERLGESRGVSMRLKQVIETSSTVDIGVLSKLWQRQQGRKSQISGILKLKHKAVSYQSKNSRISYSSIVSQMKESPPKVPVREDMSRERRVVESGKERKQIVWKGRRSMSHERELSREEKIEKTVQMLERSDIYSIIKGESWVGEEKEKEVHKKKRSVSNKGKSNSRNHKMMTRRSFERLYKLE